MGGLIPVVAEPLALRQSQPYHFGPVQHHFSLKSFAVGSCAFTSISTEADVRPGELTCTVIVPVALPLPSEATVRWAVVVVARMLRASASRVVVLRIVGS